MSTSHAHGRVNASAATLVTATKAAEDICADLLAGRAFLPPLTPVAPSKAACEEQIAALLRGHRRALDQVS